jgi:hypothetical protein
VWSVRRLVVLINVASSRPPLSIAAEPPRPFLLPHPGPATPAPPRQAPVGVSRYNDDYFCTVLAVQRPAGGGGGGVGVRFAVVCDGSLGSLQASPARPGPAQPVQRADQTGAESGALLSGQRVGEGSKSRRVVRKSRNLLTRKVVERSRKVVKKSGGSGPCGRAPKASCCCDPPCSFRRLNLSL